MSLPRGAGRAQNWKAGRTGGNLLGDGERVLELLVRRLRVRGLFFEQRRLSQDGCKLVREAIFSTYLAI